MTVNGVLVEFLGSSGQMRFCPTANCSEASLTVKMNKMEEVDGNGSSVNNKVSSFASQDFGKLIALQ